ncbi:LytTR family DNA-binding domain-containing protein [Alteromonas sp. C1M14]|uniref:LytR/AlgR family response regulator transcription factor n=1 Tax=Alteromonas sp. C1M14 TaxID=2841567 RepID=UPI001C09E8FC|nr:LytTR family DNA-binding domain-containing protein [Alteromonas sp. C1M14]MBU2978526.1 LytTR family DNA-binding domain-containing protein [Alteromonas sp. C1M14]
MYQCIVVDDEPLAQQRVVSFVEQQPGWEVIAKASEYNEAKELLINHQPHVCFMDISIIGGSGIELVNELAQQIDCRWIFTTAHSHFAIQAFEVDALDYLLKPFENKRIINALTKAEKQIADKVTHRSEMLAIKSIGSVEFVNAEDILWAKGASNYVELHCQDKVLLHRETLSRLERQLNPSKFVRVHRSSLVNLQKIKSLSSELGRYSLLHLHNGDEVKIGSAYKSHLFRVLGLDLSQR